MTDETAVEAAPPLPPFADIAVETQDWRQGWLLDHSLAIWSRVMNTTPNSGGPGATEIEIWELQLLYNGRFATINLLVKDAAFASLA